MNGMNDTQIIILLIELGVIAAVSLLKWLGIHR